MMIWLAKAFALMFGTAYAVYADRKWGAKL